MIKFFLFISIALISFCGKAQNPDFPVPDTLRVAHIGQEQGLSQLNVLQLDFDDNGYLWAGTEDGLNRFNGYTMETFSQTTIR